MVAIILIVQMPTFYYRRRSHFNLEYVKVNWDFFTNMGIAFYGYVNQFAVITILGELKNTSKIGYYSIIFRSNYIPMLLYSMVTLAGYFSFGEDIPDFIVLRPALMGSYDVLMSIAQVGVCVGMILGVIIRVRCSSEMAQFLLKSGGCIKTKAGKKVSKKAIFFINLFFVVVPGLVSLFIKENVDTYISLFSSMVCPYYIFIAPCKKLLLGCLLVIHN